MTYKKIEDCLSFADIAVQKYADKNRSMQFLSQINSTINWMPIQDLLLNYYGIGKAQEGTGRIRLCSCLNACFFKNGSRLNPTPSLKARSMTASFLNRF